MSPRRAKVPAAHQEEHARFEGFLRGRQLKLTEERRALLEAVLEWEHHFDADELHMGLKAKGQDISRATVYRTLDLLIQCGLVRKQSFGDQHAHYEGVRHDEHHDHLICLSCGNITEFYRPDLEALQEAICEAHGFRPLHHSLQIFGLCANCKDKADDPDVMSRVSQIHT